MADANGGREAILVRIRAALKTPSGRPSAPLHTPVFAPATLEPIESFRLHCKANLADCFITTNHSGTADTLREVMSSVPAGEVFVQDSAEFRQLLAECGRPLQWSTTGTPQESVQATVTACDALIASTGTIVVSSKCGGRGGSVVAPVHIVVANASQLVSDLDAVFERLDQAGTPRGNSFIGFITGCSRTADIEKILVIGAHGPRRVVVILQTGL